MELANTPFSDPEQRLACFTPSVDDRVMLHDLQAALHSPPMSAVDHDAIARNFSKSSFPQRFERIVMVLYAPGHKRILVSRAREGFSTVFKRLLAHPRRAQLTEGEFRLQLDFIVMPPEPANFFAIGMTRPGRQHFEIGVDGLLYRGPDGKVHLFLPGDAYVHSIMGMGQLRDRLHKAHGEDYLRQARFERFQSVSYLSAADTWLPLYRGYPMVGSLTREKIEHALAIAVDHIQRIQDQQGKFLYYYDAALDSRRDHEHPRRDPVKNPYYNILRHCGGGLTCIYYEKWARSGHTLETTRRAIDYLVDNSFRTKLYAGREGAFVYSERKAKLGGAGIALYLLVDYQMLSGDSRYQAWADKLAWHLLNQITESGEFIYYSIYLDREISAADNQNYFSFYYPGEAVCGLAKYLHLIDPQRRAVYFDKLRQALRFLLVERPRTRADQYTAVPSDSWLMMGIKELWDFPEMRDPSYADFVFHDAQQMIEHMYKVSDAPYPDYAGAFYYNFGDYPYADGARCEGLLGAYALADKMGDRKKMAELWPALKLAAWSLMHLVNTQDAIYFATNPAMALGGIRFKYTRQWFRIDTIQHVASFYAKLLPFWTAAEETSAT